MADYEDDARYVVVLRAPMQVAGRWIRPDAQRHEFSGQFLNQVMQTADADAIASATKID